MEIVIIKSYVKEKKYGFIQTEQKSVFFHLDDVVNGDRDKIRIGQAVKFDEIPSPKGNKAEDVAYLAKKDKEFTKKRNIITAFIFALSLLISIFILMSPLTECFLYSIGIAVLACILIDYIQNLTLNEELIDDFLRLYEEKISIGEYKISKKEIRY